MLSIVRPSKLSLSDGQLLVLWKHLHLEFEFRLKFSYCVNNGKWVSVRRDEQCFRHWPWSCMTEITISSNTRFLLLKWSYYLRCSLMTYFRLFTQVRARHRKCCLIICLYITARTWVVNLLVILASSVALSSIQHALKQVAVSQLSIFGRLSTFEFRACSISEVNLEKNLVWEIPIWESFLRLCLAAIALPWVRREDWDNARDSCMSMSFTRRLSRIRTCMDTLSSCNGKLWCAWLQIRVLSLMAWEFPKLISIIEICLSSLNRSISMYVLDFMIERKYLVFDDNIYGKSLHDSWSFCETEII